MQSNPSSSVLQGQTARIASISPNPWISRLAILNAVFAFILICAGALVTGNKAALSDPTWPKFVGQPLPTKETFVGGIRYEDAHRVIASITGTITLILAIFAQLRGSMSARKLGWAAVVTVIGQILLGGVIIRYLRPPVVSMLHGVVGQLYFGLLVALAVVSSPRWLRDQHTVAGTDNDSFRSQCWWGALIVYVQIAFGTGVRHLEDQFGPTLGLHIVGAALVFMVIAWLVMRIVREYKAVKPLYRGILLAKSLLVLQILLGIASIYANRARREPEIPKMHHIIESTAHLACGSLIMATMLVLALRAQRLLAADSVPVATSGGVPA